MVGDGSDLDPRQGLLPGELDGIGHQVGKHLAQHGHIPLTDRQIRDFPLDGTAPRIRRQFVADLADQGVEIDPSILDLSTAHAGEGQQVVDQYPHLAGRVRDDLQVVLALLILHLLAPLVEQLHEAGDVPERGAQIVRHGIAEGFQFLIGGLDLCHMPLQLRVQFVDHRFGTPPVQGFHEGRRERFNGVLISLGIAALFAGQGDHAGDAPHVAQRHPHEGGDRRMTGRFFNGIGVGGRIVDDPGSPLPEADAVDAAGRHVFQEVHGLLDGDPAGLPSRLADGGRIEAPFRV